MGAVGTVAGNGVAVDDIGADADQLVVVVEETQAVAIVQGFVGGKLHPEGVAPLHLAEVLAHRLGGERRIDVGLAAMDKEIGEAAVERLLGVHLESIGAMAPRSLHKLRAAFKDGVQFLSVKGGDVFHIIRLLQPAFDFETRDTRVQ